MKKINHLNDEEIARAVVDPGGLQARLRRHLYECPVCSGRKETLGGDLARFGQISRAQTSINYRKPRIIEQRAGGTVRVWKIRPALGLGLLFASILALLLSPLAIKKDKLFTQEIVYREMVQDEQFMTEIEKLEENPLPHLFVNMEDQGEEESDVQSPDARLNRSLTNYSGSRDG